MQAEKAGYPIQVMARVLGVTRSGYYAWCARPRVAARQQANQALRRRIRLIHADSRGSYGSPRVLRALREAGDRLGRHRVMRLMRTEQLRGRPVRRFRVTTQADPLATAAPNHLNRAFRVSAPNRVWAGDMTAILTRAGWLYLAVLLDLYSRRVVGWAVRRTLDAELVCATYRAAVAARGGPPALHHSDRGSQYTSAGYQQLLRRDRVVCSMSRPGNCWDNAPVESFFRTLKSDLDRATVWRTREEATTAIADYIDGFYNVRRLHSTLDYQSPARFEASACVA
jgi:transposase InsO family protein